MATKMKRVEVNQKYVHGHEFQHEHLNSVRLDVETELAKFDIVVDENGLDVVSDQPSHLMGSAISWQQIHGLVQGDLEIRKASETYYSQELERENETLRAHVTQLNEELGMSTHELEPAKRF